MFFNSFLKSENFEPPVTVSSDQVLQMVEQYKLL